ncbi:HAMP domain-containing histidine kinase [bacterium]|nr:HAMP domain-containing histidine kinase [bacterium]
MLTKKFRQKYREKIRKIKNRCAQKFQEQNNRFVNILRHDIKTPILAQIRALEFVLADDLKKESREILQESLSSNKFLLDVIQNTIFLADFENRKHTMKLEKVNLLQEIEKMWASVKEYADIKQQNLVIKTKGKQEINVMADKTMLEKIIQNLLAGSIAYGFENSDIEVILKENKNALSMFAKNKSIYMTKDKLDSLFERKQDEDISQGDLNKLGMKLNLNVAKKLISAHNWDIVASSKKDDSSVFGFIAKKN